MSEARPDTWMPLYVRDYLADTGRLTTEQHGAYLLLIMDYWISGPPPDDDEQLASVTRLDAKSWRRIRPRIEGFFQMVDGRWRHKRIDDEIANATRNIEAKREAGARGAAKRWQKQ